MDARDRTPIDRRGARPKRLVDAVSKADVLHEGEAIGQREPHFDTGSPVLRGGIRGSGPSCRVLVTLGPLHLDPAPPQQAHKLVHQVAQFGYVFVTGGLRIGGMLETPIRTVNHRSPSIRTKDTPQVFTDDGPRA